MSKNARLSLIIVAVVAVVVAGFFLFSRNDTTAAPQSADGKVTVVEYLDLECPSCRAAYPGVERLKTEYGDRVTFDVRHFPIPSHRNAELAAVAVEAAGAQGKRDDMFRLMFDSQQEWGGQQTSQRAVFSGFAQELGLDAAAFEKALDDQALRDRVLAQRTEGSKAGVTGTPTFFINGTKFTGAPTYDGLKAAIEKVRS
ncbi:thioredoxin domain-containing protein [Lentzea sp. BCCO 10_0061]|uniref:Thioredoxin domain-containing protein n=1 Tax=Lentzea sokolovensis TaxID=3095429 RepID=A0ABU4VAQ8_9PSEU|nr:thioredoxin domain-containing protein [Lentzea sp. BCCO 10_0061]MDX8148545.1 thioredoxin domain-containing protein [Lentzea sp. BCCO 10_0061]